MAWNFEPLWWVWSATVRSGYPGKRPLPAGDRVDHDHFGYGVVERLQGSGINARVTVDFQGVGEKVLLVQYAKLRVVGR